MKYRRIVCIGIFIFVFLIPGFSLTKDEAVHLFSEGIRLFQEGAEKEEKDEAAGRALYKDALVRFLRIAEEGKGKNSKLFYNIGNTYYKLGEIGEAILWYRKAQMLAPRDVNIRDNLAFVRSLRIDSLEEKEVSRLLRTILFFHYKIPHSIRVILFCIGAAAAWTAASYYLWKRKGLAVMLVSACIGMIFFISITVDSLLEKQSPGGVITVQEVTARKGDNETYESSFTEPLHEGVEFVLVDTRPGWYYIELPDSSRTWVPEKSAQLIRIH